MGLHQHTDNSFLDGLQSVTRLAQRAKELGHTATAITDHQEVGGHLMFQNACRDAGVKPIFGMEGYLVDSVQRARDEKHKPSDFSHITLLAQNDKGLSNLWAWSSEAYTRNFYHKALSDWDFAREYGEGLYASDGCLLSYMAMAIIDDDENRAHELMGRYLDTFGDNFYMELHTWQIIGAQSEHHLKLNADMTKVNQAKVALANQYGVPLVVVNDAHYASEDEWQDHALVWEMSTGGGKTKNDDQTERGQAAAWVMDDAELYYWMSNHGIPNHVTAEAIKNSAMIGENCNAEIRSELRIPRLTNSDQDDLRMFLEHVEAGFKRKVEERGLDREKYWARVEMEVRTITSKNFAGYFNVVADYTKWAKDRMLVGPGRGSAGGSLVSYLMDITELDPIKYDLMFERFISPERKNFPDIDLDFPQKRRGEVVDYIADRYGHDCVCSIGTRAKLGPKSAIRDIARALHIPLDDTNEMAKLVEQIKEMDDREEDNEDQETWEDVIERKGGELLPWMRKYPDLFGRVERMVGMTRSAGKHPAGVLVSDRPITGELPMRFRNNTASSQFDMSEVEWLGYVKLDVLGLRHLDTLTIARDLIFERHGIFLDYYAFDEKQYDDPAIWPAVSAGGTLGLFQLESAGGTDATKAFKPMGIADVADLISINRPGVIDAGLKDVFIDRRHGVEPVHYDHPMMTRFVGKTQGILVYQEQILEVVQAIAGFTPDEADTLRSLLSKKKADKLPPFREKFFRNCLASPDFVAQSPNPRGAAEAIWNSIEASGRYSFNKAHAFAYAMIPCWEAWVKHYYYAEFITALLCTDEKKVKRYMGEARGRGLSVMPPDINISGENFTLVDNVIRFGLGSVRGIGAGAAKELISKAPYTSVADVVEKVDGKKANSAALMNLIKIGAFDEFGPRADQMVELRAIKKSKKELEIPDFASPLGLTEVEENLVGTWITHDPLGPWHKMIEDLCATEAEVERLSKGEVAMVGGLVTDVHQIRTRTGKPMGFLTIEHHDQSFRVVCFPESWEANRMFIKANTPVICRVGRLDRGIQLIVVQRLDYL